ncbi:hypothetical protein MPTK1_6g13090 [Marchantia polymorpha subsp. ruderalis]|uniref:Uncharacterized protein n=2 Tax=Marchantia polymorpha TaxID=3197 RepID=A0AAF6BRJ6_MARPO|nr:hypothetical protein MARPO_0059s0041 [Marchantia polymorpha]BBN14630.1 hypothetical protein Mp_6g13090 [Marchantia polymorpha subsp. ruderalis]|eukprot:PTQ37093.1 hypothetical protein MARPO_0059s0041 [Marchantia polymorpha]
MASEDADMGSGLDDEEALSDFEEDDLDAAPVVLVPASANVTHSAADNLKSTLAELEKERQARRAAEAANAEADSQIKRLKTFVHETIRQRDEAIKSKDERTRQLEEALQSKDEITRHRDEIVAQRDELSRQKDEILRARDASKSEIAEVARILVTQADKIMSIANLVKPFSGGPSRFPKATGLVAIALGFGMRMEEVVEEVVRQREEAVKRRDEIRLQMEQRNYSIAIEVSELEASITQLKVQVSEKSLELERNQKQASEAEHALQEQLGRTNQEAEDLKRRVNEVENQLSLVNKCISQHVQYAAKARDSLLDVLQLMPYVSESDVEVTVIGEEGLQEDPLASVRVLTELAGKVESYWKQNQEAFVKQKEDWEAHMKMLLEEKDDLVSKMIYLENGDSALGESQSVMESRRGDIGLERLSEVSVRLDGHESGEGNEGVSSRESEAANESVSSNQDNSDLTSDDCTDTHKMNGEVRQQPSMEVLQEELAAFEKRYDQAVLKNSALEEELRFLQQEIQRTANSARGEIEKLQLVVANQGKEIAEKTAYIEDLEKVAKEHYESYTSELIAAEEDVARWKEAATAEAAAGAAVLEELEKRNKEIITLNERISELKEMVEEANSKVSSKEQMAMAAIAARNAAERSLQIADERASDLRHRVEDMTRALEELEPGGDFWARGVLDMCWPWMRGRGRPGINAGGPQPVRNSAEMEELLEPWLR